MRVIVTGVAGFVGSHLADAFLADGHDVVGVDNLAVGTLTNVAHIRQNPHFHFHELDVCDYENLSSRITHADSLVHLAAYKIPRYGGAIRTLENNYKGAVNVRRLSRDLNCKTVIASTSDVYGNSVNHPSQFDNRYLPI